MDWQIWQFQTMAQDSLVKNLTNLEWNFTCGNRKPGYPSSNGPVLRSVHTLRDRMNKLEELKGTVYPKLGRLLLAYRSTPERKTGLTPGELMFNQCQCNWQDLIWPDVWQHVKAHWSSQKKQQNNGRSTQQFADRAKVLVKNFSSGSKWC